jgi:hypothetical protein
MNRGHERAPAKAHPLAHKVPDALWVMAGLDKFWPIFSLLLTVFLLYGPVVGRPHHNAYVYLIFPLLAPIPSVVYYRIASFNPYIRAFGLKGLDRVDPDARRLRALYDSSQGREVLWREAMRFTAIVWPITIAITLAVRHSLEWRFRPSEQGPTLVGASIGAFLFVGTRFIRWGLNTWLADSGRSDTERNRSASAKSGEMP